MPPLCKDAGARTHNRVKRRGVDSIGWGRMKQITFFWMCERAREHDRGVYIAYKRKDSIARNTPKTKKDPCVLLLFGVSTCSFFSQHRHWIRSLHNTPTHQSIHMKRKHTSWNLTQCLLVITFAPAWRPLHCWLRGARSHRSDAWETARKGWAPAAWAGTARPAARACAASGGRWLLRKGGMLYVKEEEEDEAGATPCAAAAAVAGPGLPWPRGVGPGRRAAGGGEASQGGGPQARPPPFVPPLPQRLSPG